LIDSELGIQEIVLFGVPEWLFRILSRGCVPRVVLDNVAFYVVLDCGSVSVVVVGVSPRSSLRWPAPGQLVKRLLEVGRIQKNRTPVDRSGSGHSPEPILSMMRSGC